GRGSAPERRLRPSAPACAGCALSAAVIRVASGEANRVCGAPPGVRPVLIDQPLRPFGSPCAMDSFEINKILGAVLFTCLAMLALNIAAGAMFTPAKPAKPGYEVAVTEQPAGGAKPEAAAPPESIEKLLASASVEKGEQAAKKC